MSLKTTLFILTVAATSLALSSETSKPTAGARFATELYPAFDNSDESVRPEKKEPRWFAFINGPEKETAAEQFAWCEACERDESFGAARRGYDALVREWPTSPEAPKAQLRLAELLLRDGDCDEAFAAYRYLLDFYSSSCDYGAVAAKMYEVAERMREEGKTVFFVRFANTADIRRAYESLVVRAPGAAFVPQALLTIASLRVDEQKFEQAVAVYERLRSLYPRSPEAVSALEGEARVRMEILKLHGYNRSRVQDTIAFLRLGLRAELPSETRGLLEAWLGEAEAMSEEDVWAATKFYDSRTRTVRSAISAYERYLKENPKGAHAEEARARLGQLKEEK